MITTSATPDDGTGAVVMAYSPAAFTPHKAQDVVRENDGRHQLVGYLGWRTILERLARRHS